MPIAEEPPVERAKISAQGRVVIPKRIRQKLSVEADDEIVFLEDSQGRIYLASPKHRLADARARFKKMFNKDGAPSVKEFIEDRRAEAAEE